MNEPTTDRTAGGPSALGPVTLAAAAIIVLLAVGSLLWPSSEVPRGAPTVLVYDSSRDDGRVDGLYAQLARKLAAASGRELKLVVAADLTTYYRRLADDPAFLVAPDGLALGVKDTEYLPLVVGRRSAPMNLRPAGVLVHRLASGDPAEPWRTQPSRTVGGDSISLTAVGAMRRAGLTAWPRDLACGPDPYDHAPVLHALRLGAFDFALVRQWDAVRFFDAGLLSPEHFGLREVTGPVPDLVVLASRQLPRHVRLRCGESLAALGRHPGHEALADRELCRELSGLHLAGFNLLLEPDLDAVRKNFAGDWLPTAD